jgi:hypothetical protein
MMDYEIAFNPFSDRKDAFLNWKKNPGAFFLQK